MRAFRARATCEIDVDLANAVRRGAGARSEPLQLIGQLGRIPVPRLDGDDEGAGERLYRLQLGGKDRGGFGLRVRRLEISSRGRDEERRKESGRGQQLMAGHDGA